MLHFIHNVNQTSQVRVQINISPEVRCDFHCAGFFENHRHLTQFCAHPVQYLSCVPIFAKHSHPAVSRGDITYKISLTLV